MGHHKADLLSSLFSLFFSFFSEEMIMEESKKDVQMYHQFDHPINHGIPPSITLQLAASKSKIPQKSTMQTSTTSSSTLPR